MTILYRFNNRFARINGRYAGSSGHGPSPVPFPTVQIGDQIWSAGVVSIDDGGTGIDTYDLSEQGYSSLGTVKYYSYDAALRIANSVQGWHLPTKSEVDTLVNYVGGGYNSTTASKLKSTEVWSNPGTNDYGFNALPYGIVDLYSGDIYNIGTESTFWQVDYYRMYILNDDSISNGTESGGYKYPLRLIKGPVPQPSTWTCWNCSNENSTSVDYCDSCGEYRYGSQATDWNCNFCGGLNGEVRTVCYNCNHTKDTYPTWYCDNCGQGNDDNDANCWCCGEYRPTPTSDWNCNFCGTTNGDDQIACYACNHDRYSHPTWWCTNCGNPNDDTDTDCWNCGEPRQ